METIVLDYCFGRVIILTHSKCQDIEKLLVDKEFNLSDCEWMTIDKIETDNLTSPQQFL